MNRQNILTRWWCALFLTKAHKTWVAIVTKLFGTVIPSRTTPVPIPNTAVKLLRAHLVFGRGDLQRKVGTVSDNLRYNCNFSFVWWKMHTFEIIKSCCFAFCFFCNIFFFPNNFFFLFEIMAGLSWRICHQHQPPKQEKKRKNKTKGKAHFSSFLLLNKI